MNQDVGVRNSVFDIPLQVVTQVVSLNLYSDVNKDNPMESNKENNEQVRMVEAPEQDTVEYTLKVGWNLVSMPLFLADNEPDDVFPGAVVYAWYPESGRYDTSETIEPWRAFWVRATAETPKTVSRTGLVMTEYVADLVGGWHMLGGVHGGAVPLAAAVTVPSGRVMSVAYAWNPVGTSNGTDTGLEEGVGYWVAVAGACWLDIS